MLQPSLYLDFSWQVISDQHGSDHFPIGIHSYTTAPPVTNGTRTLAKANWTTFSAKASSDLGRNYPNDLEDSIEHFTDILTNIANSTIPKSKPRSKKRDPVWFNDECMNSICSRRKATRKVKTSTTPANTENLRIIRTKARRTVKSTKRKSWQSFVSKINSRTSIKKVWTMVRKITGKPSASPIRHLKINNVEVSDFPDSANTIAQTFSNNSSSENCSSKLQSFHRQAENQQLKFKCSNNENYNNLFSLDELTDAISKSNDTAIGPDDVHHQMFKHLPNDALLTLYSTFLITSGLRENSLQAGVLIQLYQFLNPVKIHLPF